MQRLLRVVAPLLVVAAVAGDKLSCGECCLIQEAIQRSISANITALEAKATAGTTATATVEIGQIIWKVCRSDTWKEGRYQQALTKACTKFVKKHVELATNYWKEKASEDYKDPTMVLRMKRAVCPNPDVGACALESLPSDYSPLRPDECAVCKAVVSDLFTLVSSSRERPTQGKTSDAYYRLVGQLSSVCNELPMRHAIQPAQRDEVHDVCEELWDDHEGKLLKLALQRDEAFALALCADELEVCDDPMSRDELFVGGDTAFAASLIRDEL